MPSLPTRRLRRSRRGGADGTGQAEQPDVTSAKTIQAEGLRWIHIERPRPVDRAWLEEHFDFHPLDYEDVLSRNQRPKIDEYDDYLFIVLHFPRYDKKVGRLNAAELDLFVGPDFLITLPNEPLKSVDYLFERCHDIPAFREQYFSQGPGFLLYKIIDDSVDACFPMLGKMGNKLERLEDDVFQERADEVVRDLFNVKQEIITFRRIIRPQRAVLRDLERTKQRFMRAELEVYFDNINDASERIWDVLENYKEVVEALEGTNEALISHRVNDTVRVLTAISVVVLPLTFIASLWGMNVKVPGEGQFPPFFILLGVCLVLLVLMVVFFRRRGWL
jgi:magnesium transporter